MNSASIVFHEIHKRIKQFFSTVQSGLPGNLLSVASSETKSSLGNHVKPVTAANEHSSHHLAFGIRAILGRPEESLRVLLSEIFYFLSFDITGHQTKFSYT